MSKKFATKLFKPSPYDHTKFFAKQPDSQAMQRQFQNSICVLDSDRQKAKRLSKIKCVT